MEDIITKLEREELKVASLSKRIIAMTIDDMLISILIVIAFSTLLPMRKHEKK
ncbi:MAG: hypothetical protein ABGX26_08505 [Nautiliaceae bacterium]|jgi:uncharacterized RDD family membrane protein YckC